MWSDSHFSPGGDELMQRVWPCHNSKCVRHCLNAHLGGHLKNAAEVMNLGAFKSSLLKKLHIFQYMGKTFWVEFQWVPLKFHIKYLTHTLKDMIFIQCWKFKSSLRSTNLYVFLKCPPGSPEISSSCPAVYFIKSCCGRQPITPEIAYLAEMAKNRSMYRNQIGPCSCRNRLNFLLKIMIKKS